MGYIELLEKLKALPPEKQAEVWDFVEFLTAQCAARSNRSHDRGEWTNAGFSAFALAQAMRGMEDESALYTLDDLRERW